MLVLIKDNFAYLSIPKNGSSTFNYFLTINGWKETVVNNDLDLTKFFVWGHLTNPESRHTKGIAEYLCMNKQQSLINNDFIGKTLISGVFDVHTYSVTSILGKYVSMPIFWIPLDITITKWNKYPTLPEELNGNDLTNDFFKQHNIDLKITNAANRHQALDSVIKLRKQIEDYKIKYKDEYLTLYKHVLDPDIILYEKTVETFRKKYAEVSNNESLTLRA